MAGAGPVDLAAVALLDLAAVALLDLAAVALRARPQMAAPGPPARVELAAERVALEDRAAPGLVARALAEQPARGPAALAQVGQVATAAPVWMPAAMAGAM